MCFVYPEHGGELSGSVCKLLTNYKNKTSNLLSTCGMFQKFLILVIKS